MSGIVYIRLLLLLILVSSQAFAGATLPPCQVDLPVWEPTHLTVILEKNQTLSQILFRLRTTTTNFCLYGKMGWMTRSQNLNSHIRNWNDIKPGTAIKLVYPKLVTRKMEDLVAPIRAPVKEKAVPKLKKFKNKKSRTLYQDRQYFIAGVRYGLSMSNEDFLKGSSFLGLLLETNSLKFSGPRIYADIVPYRSTKSTGDLKIGFGWYRILAGWAFAMYSSTINSSFHLTPRIGYYDLTGDFPISDAKGLFSSQRVHVSGATSVGLEGDVEFSWLGPRMRLWTGIDASGTQVGIASQKKGVRAIRCGGDLYFKGPEFRQTKLQFLLFSFYEDLYLQAKHELPEEQDFNLELLIPYIGGGLGLKF